MQWIRASSDFSIQSLGLVEDLQLQLVESLNSFSALIEERTGCQKGTKLEKIEWVRDEGRHGGGLRFQAPPFDSFHPLASPRQNANANSFAFERAFNAASSNISQVQYEDLPAKRLSAATALSSIVHPYHPLLPSLHLHISWTEYKTGTGYWRIMADLNPSHVNNEDTLVFRNALAQACQEYGKDLFNIASEQGDRYFEIPALARARGVFHFYLEEYSTASFQIDMQLARACAEAAIRSYGQALHAKVHALREPTAEELQKQLDYHTLYFFQVLTLDRGTTSGLLVHSDNDLGILGSLPSHVNRRLLETWKEKIPPQQLTLLEDLLSCLGAGPISSVTVATKKDLANALRNFYAKNPSALNLQAKGNSTPPTLENHLGML